MFWGLFKKCQAFVDILMQSKVLKIPKGAKFVRNFPPFLTEIHDILMLSKFLKIPKGAKLVRNWISSFFDRNPWYFKVLTRSVTKSNQQLVCQTNIITVGYKLKNSTKFRDEYFKNNVLTFEIMNINEINFNSFYLCLHYFSIFSPLWKA